MSKVIMDQVSKRYGKTVALNDLALTIEDGSLVTLLGPSGCGKTTALRIFAGLTVADSGKIHFDEKDVTNLKPSKRDIGMVFQAYSLFPNMTARENVEFGLLTRGVASNEIKVRVDRIFDVINLGTHQKNYPHQLSGGQQQRIALARAIVIRPRVLLLDEPLSALDAQVRVQLREEIRRVQREFGITTLFVTHDQEEALTIADKVGVMSEGSLIQLDSPKNIYESPANPTVARFIGIMNEIEVETSSNHIDIFGEKFQISPQSIFSKEKKSGKALIRPESIDISSNAERGASGKISNISFLGAISLVEINLDAGVTVKSLLSADKTNSLKINDKVQVFLNSKDVLVSD